MSQNRRNNHYHYAEQYTDGAYRRRVKASNVLHLPRRAVFFALLMLLVLGIVTATFSANNTEPDAQSSGSLIVRVRNAKAANDLVADGMDREKALSLAHFDSDLAATGTSVGNTDYYITGSASSLAWGTFTAMTKHASGYYSYYYCSDDTSFKVSTTQSYDGAFYKFTYSFWGNDSIRTTSDYFNQGNNTNANGDNNFWIKGGNYVIVWYPDTDLRSGDDRSNPLITAFSALPNGPSYRVHYNNGSSWVDEALTTTTTPSTSAPITESTSWSCVLNLSGDGSYQFCVQKLFTPYPNRSTITFKRGSGEDNHTIKYNTSLPWTCGTLSTDTSDLWINTKISGNHTFTLTSTEWYDEKIHLNVTYPQYSVTSSRNISAAAASDPTVGTTPVSISSSTLLTAASPATGYEFVNWTVTSGSVRTGAYGSGGTTYSTNFDIPKNNSDPLKLTVYPYGTSSTVTVRANYKLQEFHITYAKGDGSPVTGTISGSVATGTKQYDVTYRITTDVYSRTGYTQVGWSTSRNATSVMYYPYGSSDPNATISNTTYTTNQNLTLYPVWKLNDPTKSGANTAPEISGTTTDLVYSGTEVTHHLDPKISDCPVDATRFVTFTVLNYHNNIDAASYVSIESDPEDADFGALSTSTPGWYKVTMTVTDTDKNNGVVNSNYSASSSSSEVIVKVDLEAPTISFSLYGNTGTEEGVRDGATQNTPLLVPTGVGYDCTFSVASPIQNYTYTWYKQGDNNTMVSLGTGSSITVNKDYDISGVTSGYERSVDTEPTSEGQHPYFMVYCTAYCNYMSHTSSKSVYYLIQPLVEDFRFVPLQKVYNVGSSSSVTFAAKYNVTNSNNFSTDLYFSGNNYFNPLIEAESTSGFLTDFSNTLSRFMALAGPKYFYMYISGTVEGANVTTSSKTIHTFVGTSDSSTTKPLYFYNNEYATGVYLAGNSNDSTSHAYRVMCFYVNGAGDLGYQTAQDMYKNDANNAGKKFRVNVPADTTDVIFAFVDQDDKEVYYYGSGVTYNNGTFIFPGGPIFMGFTDQITLSDSTRVIKTTGTTTPLGNSGMVQLTCNASSYSVN